MGGGLMQLVAYGAQDVYLTGNPLITFFKVIYRRHTNFSVEAIEQTFNGSTDFSTQDKRVTATISRNGDLITNMYLQVEMPAGAYCNSLGHAMVKSVELEIGGQRIDKWYSDALEYWQELTCPEEKKAGYAMMTGKKATNLNNIFTEATTLYIPLQFFFNRNVGLALPLIALQYHEVKLHIEFRKFDYLYATVNTADKFTGDDGAAEKANTSNFTNPADIDDAGVTYNPSSRTEPKVSLFVDYVYLDTDERRRFAQVSHEMLIEQLQYTGDDSIGENVTSARIKMNFNHPVKELVWVVQDDRAIGLNQYFNYGRSDSMPVSDPSTLVGNANSLATTPALKSAKIMLNGHDRFTERPESYFRLVQPYQCHTRVPSKNIYTYSFALRPEEHQPSGTCNFSRIDNATLHLTFAAGIKSSKVKVYAHSYNVLRIMSGMGGLAFSN